MKILYHHRIASKDGQYVHVEELTRALKKLGHEIIMIGPESVEKDEFGSEGGIVPILKRFIPGMLYELMELAYAFHAYRKLTKSVKIHQPDCLYERYNLFMPAGVWLKKRYNLIMLSEVNAPLFQERNKYNGISLPRLARWSEKYVWKNADMVLPVTKVLSRYPIECGVKEECVEVIPNGIDWEKFSDMPDLEQAKRELGLEGKLVLGFTGFIREWHGLERIVDIIANDDKRERYFLVVGDGPARESISKYAAKKGVSDLFSITGIVSRDNIAKYVAAFDIALQPDVVPYASPLKLFEYLAMGRAIVAPDSANIKEVLQHNKNALLFDHNNPDTLPQLIEQLCIDRELRSRLSKGARETISEGGYTWLNNAERVVDLFKRLGVKE